jgi:hypothetical protein
VRVTNRRLLVGTGSVRKPHKALIRYVVALDGDEWGNGPFTDGYVTFPARRAAIELTAEKVRIPSPEGQAAFETPVAIVITRAAHEPLRAALLESAKAPVRDGAYRA